VRAGVVAKRVVPRLICKMFLVGKMIKTKACNDDVDEEVRRKFSVKCYVRLNKAVILLSRVTGSRSRRMRRAGRSTKAEIWNFVGKIYEEKRRAL
jgi:hypothetical protein